MASALHLSARTQRWSLNTACPVRAQTEVDAEIQLVQMREEITDMMDLSQERLLEQSKARALPLPRPARPARPEPSARS